MTAKEFKHWLAGYMVGCGAKNIEDLTKAQVLKALERAGDIEPEYHSYWWGNYPSVTYKTGEMPATSGGTISKGASSLMDELTNILNKI
jgi:hypothetical protein